MISIFREAPSNFYYLIIFCDEDSTGDPISPWNSAKTFTETNEFETPKTLSEIIKTIVASTKCDYTLRLHAHGCSDSTASFWFTFLISRLVGAESYFKKALAMTRKKNGLLASNVRLGSVTYLG